MKKVAAEDNIAISVSHVSKKFVLPHQRSNTLKSVFVNPFTRFKNERQIAVNNVSFNVKKGEFFGIVGRNGSGKSTLLKCMAGVYKPETGSISINGSLVPFIELGVGFNSDLSGRDNVYLNGALLGFSRKEMSAMYDEIVEFAELERFMDQRLRNYSSGMQVRLAFSIAIRARSDILLLDEVLAVGDSAFKQKCNDYFYSLKAQKKTIILVSHSMASIEEYCDRALLLEDGVVKKIGSPQQISYLYTKANEAVYMKSDLKRYEIEASKLQAEKGIDIKLYGKDKKKISVFEYGDEATVSVGWKDAKIKNVGVAMYSKSGKYIFGANTILDEVDIKNQHVDYKVKLNVVDDSYVFKVGFFGETGEDKLDFIDDGPTFVIASTETKKWGGLVHLEHKWR